jgi:ADP-ribose pyrophosphatase YjhB (NUDIX family)
MAQTEQVARRVDYYDDPTAPAPTRIVPAVTAVVTDTAGAILLQRRADNGLWALPGGVVEVGETVAQTIVREVKEETGLDVEPTELVGVYSDPRHVIAYADGEVRQQFSLCFAARIVGGGLRGSDESTAVRFVPPAELDTLPMHPAQRLRIAHFLERLPTPYIG